MLLEFGVENYMSFREGVSVSFRLDAKVPRSFSIVRGVAPVMGLKGANASGKTGILRALSFISIFSAHSFALDPEDMIPLAGHFHSDEPSSFFAEFDTSEASYRYELRATDRKVVHEAIFRTKTKRTKILERHNNEITFCIRSLERLKQIKLRKNVSIISLAHQYDYEELADLHDFFGDFTTNVSYSGLEVEPISEAEASEQIHGNEALRKFITEFISGCDVGISDIKIFPDTSGEKTRYFPAFFHGSLDSKHAVTSQTESSGTRALFRNLVRYKTALDRGSVMIADEIDMHLHPQISHRIVALFLDPKINRKGAQLIFSTHDSDILELLGRYRTFLVNKNENESFGYRLDEIPGDILRNDRPISPIYKSGRIGGIPRI